MVTAKKTDGEMAQAAKKTRDKCRSVCKLALRVLVIVFLVTMSLRSRGDYLKKTILAGAQMVVELPVVEDPEEPSSIKIDGTCRENPYAASFHSSLDSIRSKADTWLANMDSHLLEASKDEMKEHTWARFFPFDTMTECATSCVGGPCRSDTSKIICGIDKLQTEEKCVVYSMGGNNQWEFELDILAKTPCQVHTFDCTGNIARFQKPQHPRLTFHHICLGSEHVPYNEGQQCKGGICGDILTLYQIQTMLGHKRIDLFKMDIEGYEWPIFESWPELGDTNQAADMVLPMQILVELHYQTQMPALWLPGQKRSRVDFKFAKDMVKLQEHLLKAGYAVGFRDDNKACRHCTELTLVRYQCHH
jgi:hypothetical protein